MKPQMNTDQHH